MPGMGFLRRRVVGMLVGEKRERCKTGRLVLERDLIKSR